MQVRNFNRPARIRLGPGGTSTQVFPQGKRWSVTSVTFNVAATSGAFQSVNLKDGGTGGTVKWKGSITGAVLGASAHFDFPEGAKFEDGIATTNGVGLDAYITAVDVSEGI